jgi:hypothetical protein
MRESAAKIVAVRMNLRTMKKEQQECATGDKTPQARRENAEE